MLFSLFIPYQIQYIEGIYSFAVNTINIGEVRFGFSASIFWRP